MSRKRRRQLLHGGLPRLVLLVGLATAALGTLRLLHPVSAEQSRPLRARSFSIAAPSSPIHAATPASETARSPSTATPSSGRGRRSGSDDLARADRAAVAFVRAWARPDLPQPVWLAGLEPLMTPELAEHLATDEPWTVPAHQLTGSPRGHVRAAGAVVVVPTDAGPVAVTLVRRGNDLLVNGIEEGS